MAWYDIFGGETIGKIADVFGKLADALNKSTLDKTEKERLLNLVAMASLEYRATRDWMKWVALGSGSLLWLIVFNNSIIAPYIESVKTLNFPWELFVVFLFSIGADKLIEVVNNKREKQ